MNRRKGETDMGHFSFVAESQPSESSPMTVTYSLWINHSAWLQNAHHFLYPTAVYIGHSSGIILTKNTDIVSKWGKCMCHQNFNASIWKMGHLEENIKSTGDRESVCPCTHWLKLRSWGNVLRGESTGCGPRRTIYTNVVMERRREARVRPGERQALLSGRAQSHPQGARASGTGKDGRSQEREELQLEFRLGCRATVEFSCWNGRVQTGWGAQYRCCCLQRHLQAVRGITSPRTHIFLRMGFGWKMCPETGYLGVTLVHHLSQFPGKLCILLLLKSL